MHDGGRVEEVVDDFGNDGQVAGRQDFAVVDNLRIGDSYANWWMMRWIRTEDGGWVRPWPWDIVMRPMRFLWGTRQLTARAFRVRTRLLSV